MAAWRFRAAAALGLAAVLLSGCAQLTTPRSVYFYDRAEAAGGLVEPDRQVLFIDREGDLYPRDGLPPALISGSAAPNGSLRHISRTENSGLCAAARGGETAALCASLSGEAWNEQVWQAAQAAMWRDRARTTLEILPADERATLVVLIHGFNVACASDIDGSACTSASVYQPARAAVREAAPAGERLYFLEVNWNGYKSRTLDRGWGDAQFSGPLAGFALRRYFNALAELSEAQDRPFPQVRVLTHSSGAFVAGAAFGNPYHVLPALHDPDRRQSRYPDFFRHRAAETGPDRIPDIEDLRLAMFAPATAANTFIASSECGDLGDLGHGCAPENRIPAGLLVRDASLWFSVNPNDRGLRKAVLPPAWTGAVGASGLGSNDREACRLVDGAPAGMRATAVDHTSEPSWAVNHTHAWTTYLEHDNAATMIAALFAETPPAEVPGAIRCPV